MEIQSLKLFVTDADLAEMARQHMPPNDGLEDVQARFTPEGVVVQGQYSTGFGFKVPFETLWQLSTAGPQILIRLDTIKVAGLPGGMLRTVLMRMIRDAVENQPGVTATDDIISVDASAIARANKGDLRVNFTAVRLSVGAAVVEAG